MIQLILFIYRDRIFVFHSLPFPPLSLLTLQFTYSINSEQKVQQMISKTVNFINDTHALKRRYFKAELQNSLQKLKKYTKETKPERRELFFLAVPLFQTLG